MQKAGKVCLIGAGPGNPELLTLAGLCGAVKRSALGGAAIFVIGEVVSLAAVARNTNTLREIA